MLASGLIEVLFSWLNHVFSWLVTQGMSGRLEWLEAYWPLLVLAIGLICVTVDLAVWLMRYRIQGVRKWANSGLTGLLVRGVRALARRLNPKERIAAQSGGALVNERIGRQTGVPRLRPAAPRREDPVDVKLLTDMPPKPRQAQPRPAAAQKTVDAPTRPVSPAQAKDPDEAPTKR